MPFPGMLLQFMVCNFAHLSSAFAAPTMQEFKSSPAVHRASTPIQKRVVLHYLFKASSHLLSLSLSLPARIVHERSQWKTTSLEEKLHGSCDCFSNFLAGWCVCSDDVSFTFMIHENL